MTQTIQLHAFHVNPRCHLILRCFLVFRMKCRFCKVRYKFHVVEMSTQLVILEEQTLPCLACRLLTHFPCSFFFSSNQLNYLNHFLYSCQESKRSNPQLLSKMAKQAAGSKNDLSPSWMCVSENPEKYTAGLFAGWSHLNKNNFRQCSYSLKEHSFIFIQTLWFWTKLRETVDVDGLH